MSKEIEKKLDDLSRKMGAGFSKLRLEGAQSRLDMAEAMLRLEEEAKSLGADVRAIALEHGDRLTELEEHAN